MKNILKNLKLNETNVSMLLGIVVVIIVGGLLVNYFKSANKTGSTSSTDTALSSDQIAITPKPSLSELPSQYKVQTGDSLWVIAESVYGSGYNWVDIQNANKETIGANPDNLLAGTTLTIPQAEPKLTTAVATTPLTHTVVRGESLSQVAFNLCGNAYLWSSIATQNSVKDANMIEVGQVLKFTCK